MIYLLNMLIFHRKLRFSEPGEIHWIDCPSSIFAKDPLWFCSSIVMSRRTSTVSPGSTCPSFRRIRSPAAFSKRPAAWRIFLRKIHGEIHGENHGCLSWQMILIYSMTTHVEDVFWYATWTDEYCMIYIYMDQTWGPNGPLKLGVWKIGHGSYDCPSLIHYRGSNEPKNRDVSGYTMIYPLVMSK